MKNLLDILRFGNEKQIQDIDSKEYPISDTHKRNIWDRITGKNKNFRIERKSNFKQRLAFKLSQFKKGIEVKESQQKTSVIHINENGDIHLIPAFHSSNTLHYNADKPYRKKFNYAKRITIHYFDGTSEEGFLCDSIAPANFKVNPSIEKSAIHSQIEFENAYDTFEKDLIRTTAFNYSDKQVKMFIMFLLAGIGLGSLVWLGAYIILFLQ